MIGYLCANVIQEAEAARWHLNYYCLITGAENERIRKRLARAAKRIGYKIVPTLVPTLAGEG